MCICNSWTPGGGGGLVTKLCPSLVPPWTVACQAPLSIGFSRQEYGGLPFPSPGDLTDPGIEPRSPALQEDSLLTETPGKPLGPLYRQISDLAKVFFFLRNYWSDTQSPQHALN